MHDSERAAQSNVLTILAPKILASPEGLIDFMTIGRLVAWLAILAIVLLNIVPAAERPITDLGQAFEHVVAFGIVAALFAFAYPLRSWQLLLLALLFCGGIESLQIPLPTRHARINDFVIDVLGSWMTICVVAVARKVARVGSLRARAWHRSGR